MADGVYTGQNSSEPTLQAEIIRHRLLCVNISASGFMNPRDASSHASMDPNVMVGFAPEGGPHFILSPETPDGSKTYGFEFAIVTTQAMPLAQAADPLPGGFTLTWWEMIGTTQEPESTFPPIWASFLPQTGVNVNELYHSFDVNATALRLQITNVTPVGPGGPGGSVLIMFSEL